MPVGIVFVSHSAGIAAGLVELAGQMAPDVRLVAAGGTDEGGIGTSFDRVTAAIGEADDGAGVLLIGDLGSAILTAETAVDLLDEPPGAGVLVLDAPLVEGGVAAAVAAQGGADLEGAAAAARSAAGAAEDDGPRDAGTAGNGPAGASAVLSAEAVLADPDGLHARPAALLVRTVAGFDARVTVDGADASSLLAVLARGLRRGARVAVRAEGPQAAEALAAATALLEHPGEAPAG